MAELQVNNLVPSVLQTLRKEVEDAIKPIAEKYGVRMWTAGQAVAGATHFSIPVEGEVTDRG